MSNQHEVVITTPATPAEAPVVSSRPDNVPAEYWDEATKSINTEALLAAVAAPAGDTGEAPKADEEAPKVDEEKKAEALADEAGIDVGAVEAAFLETGEVPADTYEKAAKVGITKEMVDEFVGYRVRQADMLREEILQPFGGTEAVGKMAEWAGTNWTKEKAESFNKLVNSGDRGSIELAVRGLQADYQKANGTRPRLVSGTGGAAASASGVYRSIQELAADQRDPRYATDPAFQKAVFEKLRRSSI